MDLKEFIKSTISQIGFAIHELNSEGHEIIVNPATCYSEKVVRRNNKDYNQTRLNFHIELAIDEDKAKNAKVGVLANMVGIGGQYEKHNASSATTSVDFYLDVLLPQG